jgi:hypothetical protein
MPSTVKVRIKSARNLPIMDKTKHHHPSQQQSGASAAAGVPSANHNGKGSLSMSNLRSIPSTVGSTVTSMSMGGPPSTDAYVVVTLGGHVNLTDQEEESSQSKQKRYTQKTRVCKRTLNPVWDEGALRAYRR